MQQLSFGKTLVFCGSIRHIRQMPQQFSVKRYISVFWNIWMKVFSRKRKIYFFVVVLYTRRCYNTKNAVPRHRNGGRMMNKIVCDVCGTSYPETVAQCPICGTAKTDANKTTTGGEAGYAYVKGGRFSHANVKKRNAGKQELPRVVAPAKPVKEAPKQEPAPAKPAKPAQPPRPKAPARRKPPKKTRRSYANVVLAIIAFLLVIGIVVVFGYFVKGYLENNQPTQPSTSTAPQSTKPQNTQVPCTGIRFALGEKTFTSLSDKFQLSIIISPSNTTDTVWYDTSNDQVAIVSEKGIVTPVGDGECIIYAHCGDFTAECVITCQVGFIPTTPPDPNATTQPTDPAVVLELNREDFTLNGYGDSHVLYSGELDPAEITWTSSDETVATVTNGKVVAVGNGNATITAEYMGQKATCEVHCTNVVVSSYELRTRYGLGNDFTISVGDTITLYMVEKESGLRIQAENLIFALSKEGVITIDETGKITAVGTGTVTVTVIYGEHILKAKVHVKKAS